MATLNDVRLALWDAYAQMDAAGKNIPRKTGEGYLEVHYDDWHNSGTRNRFAEPSAVAIISQFMQSGEREFWFVRGPSARLAPNMWQAPDVCQRAVDVINAWLAKRLANDTGPL